jgi:hypothetical protein
MQKEPYLIWKEQGYQEFSINDGEFNQKCFHYKNASFQLKIKGNQNTYKKWRI